MHIGQKQSDTFGVSRTWKTPSDVYSEIKSVMDKYGIPEHVWVPIAKLESGLDPYARNVTPYEDSRGIFQINVKSNPQFAGLDLYNPLVNAEIAAKYFLLPAYEKVKDIPNPGFQAQYVWQYGIRPEWNAEKAGKIWQLAEEVSSGKTREVVSEEKPTPWYVSIFDRIEEGILTGIVYIILVAIGIAAFYFLFKEGGK